MAGRARLIQASFSGGEISPASLGLVDIPAWSRSLAKARNVSLRSSGAVDRRAGFEFVGLAMTPATTTGRLIRFQTAINQSYQLELSGGYMCVWNVQTRELIMSEGSPLKLAIPWTDEELSGVRTWQKHDVIWFAHISRQYPVKVLKRIGEDLFEFGDFETNEGPFKPLQKAPAVLAFSGVSGSITVTADAASFSPGHVGALIRLQPNGGADGWSNWSFNQPHDVGDYCRNGYRIYRCTFKADPGKTGDAPPIHEEGEEWDGSSRDHLKWLFEGYLYGLLKITGYVSPTQVTATVLRRLPFYGSMSQSTDYWQIGSFSDEDGWPACGAIYEARFGLFGSFTEPDRVQLGRTNRYGPDDADFRPPYDTEVTDSDAVSVSIDDGQTAFFCWSVVQNGLRIGTTQGVRYIAGPSRDESITPAGAVPRDLTHIPCSTISEPVRAGDALLYMDYSNRRLIEVPGSGDQTPINLLELADHFARPGIVQLCWLGGQTEQVWARDVTGRLLSMTYARQNGAIGWCRHDIGGRYGRHAAKVVSISDAIGPNGLPELWAKVCRTVSGVEICTIEVMRQPFDNDGERLEDAICLDASSVYDFWVDGSATIEPTEGEEVTIRTAASVFSETDEGREFWLSCNGAAKTEGDGPSPVKVRLTTFVSSVEFEAELIGAADLAFYGSGEIQRFGFPITSLSGLGWLEGETVFVNADGRKFGPFIVEDASISFERPSMKGNVGLSYTSLIRTLPVTGAEGLGTGRTARGKVSDVGIIPDGVADGRLRRMGARSDEYVDLYGRRMSDALGVLPDASFEDQTIFLDPMTDNYKQIEIVSDGPLPCSIAALMLKVESYG